jgi:magnesium chelatase accessory protein
MDWAARQARWPNAGASRFVQARPHRWHVQDLGPPDAPALLLLHGAGGATHSWRDLAPLLARDWRVIAPDLPGHGFTRLGAMQRSSLPLMAEDMATLLARIDVRPLALVGHSAGGALALQMARRMDPPPAAVVGLNPALDSFEGVAGWLFPVMARALALNPFVAPAFARMASHRSVRALVDGTGSRLDDAGIALYRDCIADADHVEGTLKMMAQWRLDGLQAALPGIDLPVLFLVGAGDRAVPPETAARAAARLPNAEVERLAGLGHLAHEEAPGPVAARISAFLWRGA